MKRKTKKKIKALGKSFVLDLLLIVKDLAELWPEPFESPYAYQRRISSTYPRFSPQRVSRNLYYLKKQGLIEKKKVRSRFVYQLTLSGKQKLLMSKISFNKTNPKDGTSCVIIYDIPNEKYKHRKLLRRFLIKNGFMNIQKSVLIGPQFLPKEFLELLHELGLRRNVTIIKGKLLYS
ncbi:MAG: hypothetical protein HYV13_00045 [Candidatus Doudnabacteria bacterium]|nr:hypothetical protein [Candidatus Doudnabacteria bacterium]